MTETGLQITRFVREWANQDLLYENALKVSTNFEESISGLKYQTRESLINVMERAMVSGGVSIPTIVQAAHRLDEELESAKWLSIDTGKTWEPLVCDKNVWVKAFDPKEMT